VSPNPGRPSFRSRLEILAEELEDAIIDAVGDNDLAHAADLWAASATVWSAAAQLDQATEA
jgi:hypothetical protein